MMPKWFSNLFSSVPQETPPDTSSSLDKKAHSELIDNIISGKLLEKAAETGMPSCKDCGAKLSADGKCPLKCEEAKILNSSIKVSLVAELEKEAGAYELGDTETQTAAKSHESQVKAASDYGLAEMLTEFHLKGQGVQERWYLEFPKCLEEVKKNRKDCESELLKEIPPPAVIERMKWLNEVMVDNRGEDFEPTDAKNLYGPLFEVEGKQTWDKAKDIWKEEKLDEKKQYENQMPKDQRPGREEKDPQEHQAPRSTTAGVHDKDDLQLIPQDKFLLHYRKVKDGEKYFKWFCTEEAAEKAAKDLKEKEFALDSKVKDFSKEFELKERETLQKEAKVEKQADIPSPWAVAKDGDTEVIARITPEEVLKETKEKPKIEAHLITAGKPCSKCRRTNRPVEDTYNLEGLSSKKYKYLCEPCYKYESGQIEDSPSLENMPSYTSSLKVNAGLKSILKKLRRQLNQHDAEDVEGLNELISAIEGVEKQLDKKEQEKEERRKKKEEQGLPPDPADAPIPEDPEDLEEADDKAEAPKVEEPKKEEPEEELAEKKAYQFIYREPNVDVTALDEPAGGIEELNPQEQKLWKEYSSKAFGWAMSVANDKFPGKMSKDEIRSAAMDALFNSIKKYDPRDPSMAKFETFLYRNLHNEVLTHRQQHATTFDLKKFKERAYHAQTSDEREKLLEEVNRLEQQMKILPKDSPEFEKLKKERQRLKSLILHEQPEVMPLETPIGEGGSSSSEDEGGQTLYDLVGDVAGEMPDVQLEKSEQESISKQVIEEAQKQLQGKDLEFFNLLLQGYNLSEAGSMLGLKHPLELQYRDRISKPIKWIFKKLTMGLGKGQAEASQAISVQEFIKSGQKCDWCNKDVFTDNVIVYEGGSKVNRHLCTKCCDKAKRQEAFEGLARS